MFAAGYLVDCGSAVSVLSPTQEEKCHPRPIENLVFCKRATPPHIRPAEVYFTLMDRTCSHDMIVADVVHPILGMDFFQDGEGKRFLIDLILLIASTLEECPVETAPQFTRFPRLQTSGCALQKTLITLRNSTTTNMLGCGWIFLKSPIPV